eukprot:m.94579 g.94579  ORF g.94579 m.94579 type:complete len:1573 (+) comp13452_c0_seq1:154-4872(+)
MATHWLLKPQFLFISVILLFRIDVGNTFNLKGSPNRPDHIIIDNNAGALLSSLAGVTILDTGLVVKSTACQKTATQPAALLAAFSSLLEIRGTLQLEKGSCMTNIGFLPKLAVVRGDFAENNTAITLSGGFTISQFPRLQYVSGHVSVDDVKTTLPSTCSTECGERGCVEGKSACCSEDCIGGCSADGICNACREGTLRAPSDACMASCPVGTKQYGFRIKDVSSYIVTTSHPIRCTSSTAPGMGKGGWGIDEHYRYCLSSCPAGYFTTADGRSCVSKCPGLVYPDFNTNICPAGGKGKVCDIYLDNQEDQYGVYTEVTSLCHLEVLLDLNCEILNGSIFINKLSDVLSDPTSLDAMRKLKRISGFVYFFQTAIPSLEFLDNVESIAECSVTDDPMLPKCKDEDEGDRWALFLYETPLYVSENPYLQSLSLSSLTRMGGPDNNGYVVNIQDNLQLCLHDTVNWKEISGINTDAAYRFGFTSEYLNSQRMLRNLDGYSPEQKELFKTAPSHPFLCLARSCPDICGSRGCWDFNGDKCQKCKDENQVLRQGVCISGGCEAGYPSPGYFEDTDGRLCKPCHTTCDDCTGERADECLSCVGSKVLLPDGTCADSCDRSFYANVNNICTPCTPGCLECESATVCTKCDVTPPFNFYLDGVTCVVKADCPNGTYPADNIAECAPCDGRCKTCDSYGSNSCLSCFEGDIYFKETRRCQETCPQSFYEEEGVCQPCHPLCLDCFGPLSTQCGQCKEGYPKLDNTTCVGVGECPPGMFSSLDLEKNIPLCDDCSQDCHTCAGSNRFTYQITFCTRCMNSKYLSPVDFTCNATCPPETYGSGIEDTDRLCLDCNQCSDTEYARVPCTHTSNRECEECTVCSDTQYENRTCGIGLALGYDTICAEATVCNMTTQFEAVLVTPTTDRMCQNLTICDSEFERVSVPATATSDRECENFVCLEGGSGFQKCLNGGECVPLEKGFECACVENFCGDTCEREYDENNNCGVGAASEGEDTVITTATVAAALIVIAILISIALWMLTKRQIKKEKNQFFEAFKKGETIPQDEWEIRRQDLTVGEQIGSGNFGNVNKGMYRDPRIKIPERKTDTTLFINPAQEVAVKSLRMSNPDYGMMNTTGPRLEDPQMHQAAKDFFDEMKLMKEIKKHHNVISLVGVVTVDKPYLIVTEFARFGDLRNFLMDRRSTSGRAAQVDTVDMISFLIQIANGMDFLSVDHKIVHRDLAARNVLVTEINKQWIMKISDFGLARDLYEEDFYQKSEQGQMAIKWMSPEALADRRFTTAGDIWSFGIVMWEVTSMGMSPYPGHTNSEILGALLSGYRMSAPKECPRGLYNAMMKCWQMEPKDRPTFADLRQTFIDMSQFSDQKLNLILGQNIKDFGALYEAIQSDPNYEDPIMERESSVRTRDSVNNFHPTLLNGPHYSVANPAFDDDFTPRGEAINDEVMYSLASDSGPGGNKGPVPDDHMYSLATTAAPENLYHMADDGGPAQSQHVLYDQASADKVKTKRRPSAERQKSKKAPGKKTQEQSTFKKPSTSSKKGKSEVETRKSEVQPNNYLVVEDSDESDGV